MARVDRHPWRKHTQSRRATAGDATIGAMEISPQSVVALTWTLKDSLGDTLDELQERGYDALRIDDEGSR